jgi:TRAP-type C4-dicarboxylate transport system permease small subunit
MTENAPKPAVLRVVAAVILGIFVGLFLFFGLALVIGAFNNMMGTSIPVSTQVTENVISVILLAVIIITCVAVFCRMVYTTPPTTPEFEIPETIDKF